jgi:hypothetical protein
MTHTSPIAAHAEASSKGNLFGVPLGNMGWFASLLMGVASGFMAFFASTFCAIIFILVDHTAAHGSIDFTISYRLIGLPIGLIVMAAALSYLGTLWCRRIFRRT